MSREKAFLAIYVSVAISYLGVGLVAPLISIVLAEHGANSFIVGLVGTTMFAAFTLASFPIGAGIDRLGAKPVLIAGLVVYGVALLLFALINSIALFFVMRFIEGVGGAAISVGTETMIGQLSQDHERAKRMSYYAVAVGAGWATGPLAGTLLFNWQHSLPFFACCAFSVLAGAAVWVAVPKTEVSSHHEASVWREFSLRLLAPISAGTLHGYLMSSMVTLFPLYLKNLKISGTATGGIITAVIFGTIISQVPIGYAADRYGKEKVLLFSSVIVTIIFIVMPRNTTWDSFLMTGAVLGAFAGSFYPVGLSLIGERVKPRRLGAANSLFTLMFGIGSLSGPALSGLAMNRFGDKWLFYLAAIVTALFGLELSFLRNRNERQSKVDNRQPG